MGNGVYVDGERYNSLLTLAACVHDCNDEYDSQTESRARDTEVRVLLAILLFLYRFYYFFFFSFLSNNFFNLVISNFSLIIIDTAQRRRH